MSGYQTGNKKSTWLSRVAKNQTGNDNSTLVCLKGRQVPDWQKELPIGLKDNQVPDWQQELEDGSLAQLSLAANCLDLVQTASSLLDYTYTPHKNV